MHLTAGGTAIAWGDDGEIDMPATALERLAGEQMSGLDFSEFLARNKLTYEAAAASLGISRRLVGYYASGGRSRATLPWRAAISRRSGSRNPGAKGVGGTPEPRTPFLSHYAGRARR